MKRTWKYFLKDLPDDATPLVIGLQREELLFVGQLSWTAQWGWQQAQSIRGECFRIRLEWLCTSPWLQPYPEKAARGWRKQWAKSQLASFCSGLCLLVCVYSNVHFYGHEHLCVYVYIQTKQFLFLCSHLHICSSLSGVYACQWMDALLGCGVT